MTQYRQRTRRIRIQMGRGNQDWVSERPRSKRTKEYLDKDARGLGTTFVSPPEEHVERLLRDKLIEVIETEDASGEGCEPPDQDLA